MQPRKLTFRMQPYFNPTKPNVEDNLNIFENGRQHQFYFKLKTTSIVLLMEDNPIFLSGNRTLYSPLCVSVVCVYLSHAFSPWTLARVLCLFLMEDDLNILVNGRRPQYSFSFPYFIFS